MLIETRGLSVRLGQRKVLENIDMGLEPGEIVTIIGPNGSGKSTLLRALIGAVKPASGQVLRSAGLKIGYVPQRVHIDETLPMPVRRFMSLPRRPSAEALDAALAGAGVAGPRQRRLC